MTKKEVFEFAIDFVSKVSEMGFKYAEFSFHGYFVGVSVENDKGKFCFYNLEWNDNTDMTKHSVKKMKAFLKRNQHKMCA